VLLIGEHTTPTIRPVAGHCFAADAAVTPISALGFNSVGVAEIQLSRRCLFVYIAITVATLMEDDRSG